ncbi:2-oxoglutarate ferredoxin oxidoreductase subunit alpha [Ignicoccus pacificus DSM 13166]|uniref:2-oxoacid oxidoreductase (ferredoxin) n=1 Tax=Ignicoccus pacificus DSM 13166 TaxID=940294 RepID=A0A977K9Z8_9CREN|nr:2-oxoglutarate ferredoxin oxidoreductase subunit alpha [Ignicoccus pacificus DSM 13166]
MKPGKYFESGAWAAAMGALASGATFFSYYPIEPATDIAEEMVRYGPKNGLLVFEAEDEISALGAAIGASWAGAKAFTSTSGPGFSLMQEHVSYAAMTETPVVLINGMREGPSTGQATKAAQQDVMQTKWGGHGDYEVIVYAPYNTQEMFDLTVKAFNQAERWRVPAMVMADKMTILLMEEVVIPEKVEVVNRKRPKVPPEQFEPFKPEEDLVPPMPRFGDGYRVHVTGVTHNEKGVPVSDDPWVHHKLVKRLCDKIRKNRDKIVEYEVFGDEDPEVLIFAYGFPARSAKEAIKLARSKGMKAALFRPKTLWPFPDKELKEIATKAKKVIVVEWNYGQMLNEVLKVVPEEKVSFVYRIGEIPIPPESILEEGGVRI